jgi:hypothetical protein
MGTGVNCKATSEQPRKNLRKTNDGRISESMKTPRALLVGGIGFLLGIICCYFLMTQVPGSQMGNGAMNQVQPTPAPPPMSGTSDGVMDERVVIGTRLEERASYARIIAEQNWKTLNWQLHPKGDGRRHGIVPARFGDSVDMIDLHWVPDFEIDLKEKSR